MHYLNTVALIGFFASLTISIRHIFSHLYHYYQPQYQIYICRIILFIPIYAIQSFISFHEPAFADYLELIRDCYEAYLLAIFLRLLITYIGGEEEIVSYFESKEYTRHPWPVNLVFNKLTCNRNFYWQLKRGVVQFVIMKPLISIITLLIQDKNYDKGSIHWHNPYFYIKFANHLSTSIAMYTLLLFYIATKEKLYSFAPFPKFLCIKAILFFSFWQSFYISWMFHLKLLTANFDVKGGNTAESLQNWLMCIELPCIALAHNFNFPHQDFSSESRLSMQPLLKNVEGILKVDDLIEDTHETFFKPIVKKEYKLQEINNNILQLI